MPADELRQVAPVRADVGERPRGAAELLVDAPVVIGRLEQPILEGAAMDQPDRPGDARADALARLAHRGGVAVDERKRSGEGGGRRRVDHLLRPAVVDRQRLLADDVLAGGQRGLGERKVQMIGRADVHDVDVRSFDKLLRRVERALRSERRGGEYAPFRRGCGDADQACTRETRGPSVDSTDEPRPRNGDANLSSRHERGRYRSLSPDVKQKVDEIWRVARLNTNSMLYFGLRRTRSLVHSWTCSKA